MILTLVALTLGAVEPADTVVVAPPVFRAALKDWKSRREEQGRRIAWVSPSGSAEDVRDRIRAIHAKGGVKFIVIVGDADPAMDSSASVRARSVPTFFPPARVNIHWGKEKDIASDAPYADFDDDGLPDAAIGRIPADDPAELAAMIQKVFRYEESPDFGEWRRRVNIVGCLGNFGGVIDGLLESGARRFLTEGIPPSYSTHVTYGSWKSPYCPDPRDFHAMTVERLNEGCLFWVYIGHGQRRTVDKVATPDKKSYPIFQTTDCEKLRCDRGAPIALFLACYTGAFDGDSDSLGEEMLKTSGGPVAIIAGTRVTMPYAMTTMGVELMRLYFAERSETVGELLLGAKRAMMTRPRTDTSSRFIDTMAKAMNPKSPDLAAERAEHLLLFHLLGDPTTLLSHPAAVPLTLDSAQKPSAGSTIRIKGESSLAGTCHAELVLRRDRMAVPIPHRAAYRGDDSELAEYRRVYAAANDHRRDAKDFPVKPGPFSVELKLEDNATGDYHVRVLIEGKTGYAVGSLDVSLPPAASQASAAR